jgi:hypothetical protein
MCVVFKCRKTVFQKVTFIVWIFKQNFTHWPKEILGQAVCYAGVDCTDLRSWISSAPPGEYIDRTLKQFLTLPFINSMLNTFI